MGEKRSVVFLVGASGVGKTAAAQVLEERPPWTGNTYSFDTIGVPSAEEMESEFGGGEEWQLWATRQWVNRMAEGDAPLQLIEGQTRPSFINEAAVDCPELKFLIVLLDCKPEVRRHRLTELRQQPELLTRDMENWAAYLAGQAHALGLPVIDTSRLDPEAVAQEIEARIGVA